MSTIVDIRVLDLMYEYESSGLISYGYGLDSAAAVHSMSSAGGGGGGGEAAERTRVM